MIFVGTFVRNVAGPGCFAPNTPLENAQACMYGVPSPGAPQISDLPVGLQVRPPSPYDGSDDGATSLGPKPVPFQMWAPTAGAAKVA